MKKYLIILLLAAVGTLTVFSQNISEEEILSIKEQAGSIVFENYVGPITEFNSRDEIFGIGTFLGKGKESSTAWNDKYRLYHSFQPEIQDGLDGDILAILEKAGVDHIRNLRTIISGYLQAYYDYAEKEAAVLAEFITYYNAIYYKNITYFNSRYKPGVNQYLSKENAGLSTHYSDWAGKSRIVIPLKTTSTIITGETGSNETLVMEPILDTSTISQPEVVEEMRKEDDKALETRKDMVEIREEELDQKQESIDSAQKELDQEKSQIEKKIEEKKEELVQAEDEDSGVTDTIKEELTQLEDKEEELQTEQKQLDQVQKEVEKEQEEVFHMREDIAEDENILKEKEKEKAQAEDSGTGLISSTDGEGLWFICIYKSGSPSSFGTLCKISENGEILKRSRLNSIRGNTAVNTGKGIVVIAGKEDVNTSVNAVLIDSVSLELLKQSDQSVYAGNRIWTDEDNLYIITRDNSDWVLGKYSMDLELQATSSVKVHPDTAILLTSEKLLIQNSGGTISALSLQDLSEIQK